MGRFLGNAHHNPALDSQAYKVWFPDRRTEELAANVTAEAIYARCDAGRNQYVLLDAIVDYRKDPSMAVARDEQVTLMERKLSNAPPEVGSFVVNGKTAVLPGKSWRT